MKTITIDITECLYYLIPIVVIYCISYRLFLKKYYYYYLDAEDKIIIGVLSFLITILASIIYFVILNLILKNNFIIHL